MFQHSARALTRLAARRFASGARHLSSGVDGCQTVGVIGMGLMGHGIAQVAATAGRGPRHRLLPSIAGRSTNC